MRILHVAPYYGGAWAYGGIPRAVTALAQAQAEQGHRVSVASTDAGTRSDRQSSAPAGANPEVRLFPNLSNWAAHDLQMFLPMGLRDFVSRRAREVDIAHLHGCHNFATSWAAEALREAGVPYVLSPHGTGLRTERRRLLKWGFDLAFGRGVIPGAARVVAVSSAESRDLASLGVPASRREVVPNPVDLDEHRGSDDPGSFRASLGDPRELIVYLGRLGVGKQLDVLLRAFARLRRPHCLLAIVGGDSGEGRNLHRLARRLRVTDTIRFVGLQSGPSRLRALSEADLVVYPGAREVFGLVAVEAILSGTEVVVADDSGCGELIARVGGGRVVPLGDERSLASAMREALDDPDPGAVASAAQQLRAGLSGAAVASRMTELYQRVLGLRALPT